MADLYFDSVWLRPSRARSGQPSLSRDQIVRAAVELLDAEGAAGLSMRRLGAKLDAGATSLYWHVANKDDLLELVVDEVMGEIYVPEAGDTGWRTGITILADATRTMLLRHSWMIGLLGARPTIGPNAMRNGDRTVALLSAAGFEGFELSYVSSMINAYAIGSTTIQSAIRTTLKNSGRTATDLIAEVEPYLEQIGPEHPHYDEWRRANSVDPADPERVLNDGYSFGLERLLDGLERWLAAGKPTAPAKNAA
jgi:AcrR family transcriptional regulator